MQLFVCWSVKGGSGTSAVAAMLAVALAKSEKTLLIDADGDQSFIFGVPRPSEGFRQWLAAGDGVPADALLRLTTALTPNLDLVPAGDRTSIRAQRGKEMAFDVSMVVVDAGLARDAHDIASSLVAQAETSLLVLRPCYLAARRAAATHARIDGLIVVEEARRALSGADLAEVIGAPVVATVPWDAAISRTIDAGRLGRRLPRAAKEIEQLATSLIATEAPRGR